MGAAMDPELVRIGAQGLAGELRWQPGSLGMVVFADGSGNSHVCSRNRHVAGILQGYRLATLLLELLTEHEASDLQRVSDIGLLASRLIQATDWLRAQSRQPGLPVGIFCARTGAAAAFQAAALSPSRISAIVSRSGRLDLATDALARVQAPSLLIVGGDDSEGLRLNRLALRLLTCRKRLEVVPGVSHRFEGAGTLDAVSHLAGVWFRTHLTSGPRP